MNEKLMQGIYHIPATGPLHQKVIQAFKLRLRMARDAQQKEQQQKWEDAENTYLMYMPETEVDAQRRANRTGGLPQYTTIKVPYSYAMLLTSHTYYTSVFLGRNPVFQMQGRHGESQTAESCMESQLDYQINVGGGIPALMMWLLDPGKYGHGVLGHYWDEENIPLTVYADVPETFLGVPLPGRFKKKLVTTIEKGYVGNRLYNIRPQDWLFDPRLPITRFQEGEFCIVYDTIGWNKVLRGKSDGRYYNTEFIKKEKASAQGFENEGSPHMNLPNRDITPYVLEGEVPSLVNVHEFHWELVPSELGLGNSSRPEKWVFTIANERIVLSAQPLGLRHNKFPFDVLPFETDMYSLFSRGMLEVLEPMNQTMEWLLNSHFFNVRSALNNQFIADPSKIVMKDLEDPEPGKLIRLKPAAYGQDVRTMLHQFQVQDVTRSNLSDTDVIGSLAQRMVGVTDNVMGMMNQGGRRTATEVRTSSTFGINRLKTNCEWFSATGFSPLAMKLVMSTQQLYTLERKYRIVGDMAQWGEKYLNVAPQDIQGFFDFVPVDGTMPIDRFAQANLWQQMLGTMSKVPQIMMSYDIPKIFGFVAQLSGIKNINQFRVQVVPDATLAAQAQQGNVVPLRANPNEPGQIPGMGSTG